MGYILCRFGCWERTLFSYLLVQSSRYSKQDDPLPTFCLFVFLFCTGRVPSFITQFPRLTYTMGFFAAFSSGAGSYQKTCLQKLMALEHSVIADTYRKAIENKYVEKSR